MPDAPRALDAARVMADADRTCRDMAAGMRRVAAGTDAATPVHMLAQTAAATFDAAREQFAAATPLEIPAGLRTFARAYQLKAEVHGLLDART